MKMERTFSLDVYLILTEDVIAKKKKHHKHFRTISLCCNKILIQALNKKIVQCSL